MMKKVFLFDGSRGTITGADGSPPAPPPPASASVEAEEFTTFEPDSPPPPPPSSMDTDEQPDDEDLASPPPPVFEDSFEDETSLPPPPVLMDVDLPLLDGSLMTSSDCCQMKKVGDFSYSLLGEETLDWKLGCKNGCVYVREDLPGRRFCFREGNIAPQCFGAKKM